MSSRRDFIKKKLFGGFLLASAFPFLPLKALTKNEVLLSRLAANRSNSDWNSIRKEFTIGANKSYLNTASLGPTPKVVIGAICESLNDLEARTRDGRWILKEVHQKLADFINADLEGIAITRNTTEGINIVANSIKLKEGDEVILTKDEHIGGASAWLLLQQRIGIKVKLVDLDYSGKENLQRIKNAITKQTKVVSFSHLTCTTGMLLPAKDISELCRQNDIYSCVDGAQTLGMIPIDIKDINPDFYVCSGHKWLFGPKGTGVIYMKPSIIKKLSPVFVGAYSDSKFDLQSLTLEYQLDAQRTEYGTRNASIVQGIGAAIDFIQSIGMEKVASRSNELSKRFRDGLEDNAKFEVLTPIDSKYSAAILTFRIKEKDNAAIVQKLRNEHSIVLRYIYENDLNAIRVSFAVFNTEEEVDQLVDLLQ